MNSCTLIIFGASGDLARRKLFPALYSLFERKKLARVAIVGAAWDDITSDQMLDGAREYINTIDEVVFAELKKHCSYERIDFNNESDYAKLRSHVESIEKKHELTGNRIVYCATGADFFCSITERAATSKLLSRTTGKPWHRIVYEKPFGSDLESAQKINKCIARYFDEIQTYRIDHYLTKELVGNIALVRFTNLIFEPLWNYRYIDNVQIVLAEKEGIAERGAYYDKFGALKDMVQNHMLELVALIGMEAPEKLTGEFIRAQRAKVLEKIQVVDAVLGQYEGYHQEPQVAADSKTETFAAVMLRINNPRWSGVPFYLKTGKQLDKKQTVIHIKFKQVDCLLAKNCPSDSNYLTIQITPEASFALELNAKKPGTLQEVTPIKMEFCHSCVFGTVTPESYEVIFEEIIKGEHSISVRFDEIESAWNAIDTIEALHLPVHEYKQGSKGPIEADEFAKKHGIRWRS